ncbi:hypothetical protein [Kineococcus glutinatus]|uniref:Uncharacterized protein n=1 Tax=Kineococcus glutinatus TaxID=1070872 RepID=A0ABP9I2K6_9ACTN
MEEGTTLVRVELRGVPLRERARYLQHTEELVREMTLIRIGAAQDAEQGARSPLPHRLLELAAEVQATVGPFLAQPADEADAAAARGERSVDVTVPVPLAAAPLVERVAAVLDEAEEFCRQGRYLLTLAAPADVLAYRAWLLGEFRRQMAGEAPLPWPVAA